jgi:asparagine synthase (glutamine-hydrolysing)
MPGITGIISRLPAADCLRTVQTMTAAMQHETFHTLGNFAVAELGVYGGWVAQENSFAAGQVFENKTKDVALIFCGEVFVEPAVKAQLRRDGHQFPETGGAWLVPLYEARGDKFFEELNGLFSGLLIDRRQKKVFLFNDRYGMERLYWHETPDAFYFATEAKALLRVLPETREFDADGVAHYFGVGCTMGWRSLFRGIQMLPGGSLWIFESGHCRKEKYFSPASWESQPELSAADYEAQFAATFKKILPRYFEAETSVGMALTGGFDTRMILACRSESTRSPVCYTFAGVDHKTLDDKIAARVAAACGLPHQLLPVRPDFFADFAAHTDRTVFLSDGTFGVTGAHEIYFHRQARQLSPVRLTGNYGSEVFRGVSTFKPIGLKPQIFNPNFAAAVDVAAGQLAIHRTHADTFALFKEIPWNLFGSVAAGRSQVVFRTPYLDNALVKLAYQSPQALRKSSLPASRLVAANSSILSAIPTDRGYAGKNSGLAFLSRRVFSEVTFKLDYYSNEGLPKKLAAFNPLFRLAGKTCGWAGMHKYLRYSHWFRNELKAFVSERLAAAARHEKYFNPEIIGSLAARHAGGRENFTPEINAVLTLESIERQLFKNLPHGNTD